MSLGEKYRSISVIGFCRVESDVDSCSNTPGTVKTSLSSDQVMLFRTPTA